ncbi:hypothetical protein AHF37_11263, partial [Paragonimus kellicotti]
QDQDHTVLVVWFHFFFTSIHQQPTLREAFLDLCMNVTTVLCCRMTPLQKAGVVQLVQVGLSPSNGCQGGPVTAAVGDGGNDVAMLLQASVGIGIYGKEGLDAARAGDYSIPEFRHLTELFILHGHWAYHRLSFTMNLFYYKCTALVTTQILLAFYSGFSQMVSFGSLLFALYNLTMTSLGCLLYGMFERHLPDHVLLTRPYLYRLTLDRTVHSARTLGLPSLIVHHEFVLLQMHCSGHHANLTCILLRVLPDGQFRESVVCPLQPDHDVAGLSLVWYV